PDPLLRFNLLLYSQYLVLYLIQQLPLMQQVHRIAGKYSIIIFDFALKLDILQADDLFLILLYLQLVLVLKPALLFFELVPLFLQPFGMLEDVFPLLPLVEVIKQCHEQYNIKEPGKNSIVPRRRNGKLELTDRRVPAIVISRDHL